MAIITISRQSASFGDEVCSLVAKKLNYRFVGRSEIENKILKLGFPEDKLHKYDEKVPGFFASLSKDRDEYLDYLQTAVLEEAEDNNCVIEGRGSFIILSELENHFSFRIISSMNDRIMRCKALPEYKDLPEKEIIKILENSDKQRLGFHKSFFNYQIDDPSLYHGVLNTSLLDIESAASLITETVKASVTETKEKAGMHRIDRLLICQRIVNMLILEYDLGINELRASANGEKITLFGKADSSAVVKRALTITQAELPEYTVESAIKVVQDFKVY